MHTILAKSTGIKKMTIVHACGPYGNDCSQSILSNPPANVSRQALLKPFEHTSLKEGRYSQQLFNMANNL